MATAGDPLTALAQQDQVARRAVVKAVRYVADQLADDELRRFVKDVETLLKRYSRASRPSVPEGAVR